MRLAIEVVAGRGVATVSVTFCEDEVTTITLCVKL